MGSPRDTGQCGPALASAAYGRETAGSEIAPSKNKLFTGSFSLPAATANSGASAFTSIHGMGILPSRATE
jgi:hypothetical protein